MPDSDGADVDAELFAAGLDCLEQRLAKALTAVDDRHVGLPGNEDEVGGVETAPLEPGKPTDVGQHHLLEDLVAADLVARLVPLEDRPLVGDPHEELRGQFPVHRILHLDVRLERESVAGGKRDVVEVDLVAADLDRRNLLDEGIDVIRTGGEVALLDAAVALLGHDIAPLALVCRQRSRVLAHLAGANPDKLGLHLDGVDHLQIVGVGIERIGSRRERLGDDAALAVMGEELTGSDPLGGNARAKLAGEDPALAGRNIDHLVDFVAVEERIEKMPPRTTDGLQNPLVRVVGGQDRVGLQVPPPAVDHHEETAGRYLDPLHLPLPEQLRHAQRRRCHHQPDNYPSTRHVRPPLRGLSVSTGLVRRRARRLGLPADHGGTPP